ncbi:MAG TPA: hypothetical protein VHB98_08170 [Chloroflexota bacterium]|nr:hypothetical protein [Chloroflexota bacterium]
MLRRRLITSLLLLALIGGLLQHAASAKSGSQAPAGTVTVATDVFWPYSPTMFGYNLGAPWLWDSPIMLDEHDSYFPDLAARVPTSTNGDIRLVSHDEVVTVHLKPNMRWSDGSPITPADYIGALVLEDAPCSGPFPLGGLVAVISVSHVEERQSRPPPPRAHA